MTEVLQVLPRSAGARVLACGAWLKNTACLLDGDRVQWSAQHGDLRDPAACAALEASIEQLVAQAQASGGPIDAVAHDLHPDFHSTRVALGWAQRLGVPAVAVQHHHAHLAAVQAEHGVVEPVVGLALDGVGLGTDGTAWGGELLWVAGTATSAPRWRRLGHLHPLSLPGGDAAAREPWRMTAAALHALGRGSEIEARFAPLVGEQAARIVQTLLARGASCPVTTSAGRWFDAAAGALGWGQRQTFEAQAAMALEQAATAWLADHEWRADELVAAAVPIDADGEVGSGLDLRPLLARLLALAESGTADAVGYGAALFHVALANGLARWVVQAAQQHGVHTVVLGGGCFFNRVLLQRLRHDLQTHAPHASHETGLRCLAPQDLSCGDAGLALGQAWAAATELRACA